MSESSEAHAKIKRLRAELETELCRLSWLRSEVQSEHTDRSRAACLEFERLGAEWHVEELRAALEFELRRYFRCQLQERHSAAATQISLRRVADADAFYETALEHGKERSARYLRAFQLIMQRSVDMTRAVEKQRIVERENEKVRQNRLRQRQSRSQGQSL
jgi:hypothetical protein